MDRATELRRREIDCNGVLSATDRAELAVLLRLSMLPNKRSGLQRQVDLYAMRWPKPPLSGKQAIVELWRQRMDWDQTSAQRLIERRRAR
jgi:hypothetical protein